MGFSADMISKKRVVLSSNEKTPVMVAADEVEEWRRRRPWDGLNPEILALIFVRIPAEEMVSCVPLVCRPWMEVVAGPYCWQEIDVQAWCRRRNDSHAVDLVVKKLIRRSKWSVQRLSVYRMGESGFFFAANCGKCLKVLEIPMSEITDQMISKHIKPLPNLGILDISNCLKITSKGIATFGNQCKSLIHLKRNMLPIEDSKPMDDSEAKAIADTMPKLQRIELCFGGFGDFGVSEILNKCKLLTHLDIQGSWNVELGGELEGVCEKLECFQSPWSNYSDEFPESESEGDDSEEMESESE
ncbi:unnamed protein product [Lactuca saligna]|uniref:F-box domain-containing protein n=1 Tax=Lactuca saligna TaxID=75948 RepID=A0AA35VIT6_LACSI|nr:unnamed protein product [Lactuca saligna]